MQEVFMYLMDESGSDILAFQTESRESIDGVEVATHDGDTFRLDFIDGNEYFFRREVAPFNWNVPA